MLPFLLIAFATTMISGQTYERTSKAEIRYVPVGDSYSLGEGATREQSWPSLLTRHLQGVGIQISLVANPSVTGWTSEQAIARELPIFRAAKPDFGTLLIGVNDWVQGVSEEKFRSNLNHLIGEMLAVLPGHDRLLLVTIPDFSVTPNGPKYARGRNISEGIANFNKTIRQEAARRSLPLVDIFPLSHAMRDDPSLVASDGLHPSAKAYAQWENIIFPIAHELLSRTLSGSRSPRM